MHKRLWIGLDLLCLLYKNMGCGGNYKILSNGIKDCSDCIIPHFNYDYVIEKIIQEAQP